MRLIVLVFSFSYARDYGGLQNLPSRFAVLEFHQYRLNRRTQLCRHASLYRPGQKEQRLGGSKNRDFLSVYSVLEQWKIDKSTSAARSVCLLVIERDNRIRRTNGKLVLEVALFQACLHQQELRRDVAQHCVLATAEHDRTSA